MPYYRLITWPVNHPERYVAEDVFAVDESAMGELAIKTAAFAHAFDFWEIAGPPPPPVVPLDVPPKPEPAAESEPVSVPEPEPAPKKRRVKKGAAKP